MSVIPTAFESLEMSGLLGALRGPDMSVIPTAFESLEMSELLGALQGPDVSLVPMAFESLETSGLFGALRGPHMSVIPTAFESLEMSGLLGALQGPDVSLVPTAFESLEMSGLLGALQGPDVSLIPTAFESPEMSGLLGALQGPDVSLIPTVFESLETSGLLGALQGPAIELLDFEAVVRPLAFRAPAIEPDWSAWPTLREYPDLLPAAPPIEVLSLLEALERHADTLEDDWRQECKDAGEFLRKATRGYRSAFAVENEHTFADVIRWAVGALEELACQLPEVKAKRLGPALLQLESNGVLSPEDRDSLEEVYILRNQKRGIGHGAGGAPEYTATFALFRVEMGLRMLLPLRHDRLRS